MSSEPTADDRFSAIDAAVAQRDYGRARALLEATDEGARDAGYYLKLTSVRRALGDLAGAIAAVDAALAFDPLAFLPLLLRARLLELSGAAEVAAEAFRRAVFHAPPEDRLPPSLRAELARARALVDAHVAARGARLEAAARSATANATSAAAARARRFAGNAAGITRAFPQAPTHFHYPGLPPIEFFDTALWPGLAALEAATAAIRAELEALLADRVAGEPYVHYPDGTPLDQWKALNRSADWSAIHLWRQGARVEEHAARCPETMRLFAGLDAPDVAGRSPNLMFSLLAPHTRIPPHTGVANTRLVFHLPLVVPPGCGFRCGAETRAWEEGRAFVFDDTIEHEAWNDSDSPRAVLIGDLWRPELDPHERAAVRAVMTADDRASEGVDRL